MESCIGCGIVAAAHPIIGIGRAELRSGAGPLAQHPVCTACWQDPAHRSLGADLKVAFFPREQGGSALAAAQALDAASKRGEDLGVGR